MTEGDTVRVTVKNELDEKTTVHWHGLHVPNGMDGVPPFTQAPIKPGETFTYEFVASHAGTFMYHPHINSVRQIDSGLYGLLIIDPQRPDEPRFDKDFSMMLGAWVVPAGGRGDVVRVRLVNISNLSHPMDLHGHDFKVVAKDGEPIRPEAQQVMNTLTVNPGETYDIVFVADNPGVWVFHCHGLHHTENDGVEPGGLTQVIRYEGSSGGVAPDGPRPTPTMPARMPGMGH